MKDLSHALDSVAESRRTFLHNSARLGAAVALYGAFGGISAFANSISATMPFRTINGLRLSALSFGCMGLTYHRSVKLSKKEAQRIIDRAIELGINFFDTAEVYGPRSNESLVGEILSPYKNRVIVATKFGFAKNGKNVDSSPKRIREVVDGSLKRLKLEQIPILYQHRFDPKVSPAEVASEVAKLIKAGKVAHFGLSEVDSAYIKAAHKECKVSFLQSEYHLMHRDVESSVFPTLERLKIGFIAYSPLNRGYLSGKITANATFDSSNDNRASLPRFSKEALEANYKIIDVLNHYGKTLSKNGFTPSPAQIAIAYLMAKKPYVIPLFGTSKIANLEENLGALKVLESRDFAKLLPKLEKEISAIKIMGDRYPPEQQKRVGGAK